MSSQEGAESVDVEGSAEVRLIKQRNNYENNKSRSRRRQEVQAKGRLGFTELSSETSQREFKNLLALMKGGKISVDQLKRVSGCLIKKEFAENFHAEEGCLHALAGIISGKDSNKPILGLNCFVNLTLHNLKLVHIARFAGPYLITHISGSNPQLCELSCSVLVNLTLFGDDQAHKVLLNQELFNNILNVSTSPVDNIKEASYQVLNNLLSNGDLEAEALHSLVQNIATNLTRKPPIHLLWVLYTLSSNQMLHGVLYSPGLLDTLLAISTYEIFQKCDSRPLVRVLTPIVRILGNLAAGPGSVEVSLHLIRHPDFPAIMTALLSTNYASLCQETVWLLANIVNNESVVVQEEFVDLDLMDKLEHPASTAVTRLDPYCLAG